MRVKWDKSQQFQSVNTTLRVNLRLVFSLAPMQQLIAESAWNKTISLISSLLVQGCDQCTQSSFNTLWLTWKTKKLPTSSNISQSVFRSLKALLQSRQQQMFSYTGLWYLTMQTGFCNHDKLCMIFESQFGRNVQVWKCVCRIFNQNKRIQCWWSYTSSAPMSEVSTPYSCVCVPTLWVLEPMSFNGQRRKCENLKNAAKRMKNKKKMWYQEWSLFSHFFSSPQVSQCSSEF